MALRQVDHEGTAEFDFELELEKEASNTIPTAPIVGLTDRLWNPLAMILIALLLMPGLLLAASNAGEKEFFEDDDEEKARFYMAQIIRTNEDLAHESRTMTEGQTIEATALYESFYVLRYTAILTWSANAGDVNQPDVTLEVSSDNESREPLSESQTSFDGVITLEWFINTNTTLSSQDNITTEAKNPTTFEEQFQTLSETITAIGTYDADNNPALQENMDFDLYIEVTIFALEDIQRVQP